MVSLKSSRRAQAAMEFLMTYGWAILVVLIVIGALACFGVLSPSTILPEKCTFPVSVTCADFSVGSTTITLSLVNGAGRDMNIGNVSATSEALGLPTSWDQCHCKTPTSAAYPVQFRNGLTQSFTLSEVSPGAPCATACTFRDTGRDKNRYNLSLSYTWTDSPNIAHSLTGELLARKP